MKNDDVRPHAIGLLFGYGLQFLAGMLLNLFVTIPKKHPGSSGSNYFGQSSHSLIWTLSGGGGWELAVHVYLAILLVLGSLSFFVRAMILHDKSWAIAGGLAALFTLGAFFNGLSFVDFNKDVSSMIMATCWLVAVSSLTYGLLNAAGDAKTPA
jgi:hypothetical protein